MNPLEIWILAGGKSTRMGQDKGLVLLDGKPLLSHLLSTLRRFDFPLRLIAHHPDYQQFGLSTFPDTLPGRGPLGGLYTALLYTRARAVCLVSCDSPLLPAALFERLFAHLPAGRVITGEWEGRRQPFPALYPATLLPEVARRVEQGTLKMQAIIAESGGLSVPADDLQMAHPEYFINFNTPADLEQAELFFARNKGQAPAPRPNQSIMQTIRIRAFGMVAEALSASGVAAGAALELPAVQIPDTEALMRHLLEQFPQLRALTFSLALNRQIVHGAAPLAPGDEVALLPPFSGG